jgi:hypothetical protein
MIVIMLQKYDKSTSDNTKYLTITNTNYYKEINKLEPLDVNLHTTS